MSDKQVKDLSDDKAKSSRRDFFKLASVGAAGAAATALTGTAPEADAAESKPGHLGYQLTDHVKKAYQASRF